jgi:Subtilase family
MAVDRRPGSGGGGSTRKFEVFDQDRRFGPAFTKLKDALNSAGGGLVLIDDPTALAPERLLVFEVTGQIGDFWKAVAKVDGLTFAGEEQARADEDDEDPELYLLVPNEAALKQIISLWETYTNGTALPRGWTKWRDLFSQLKNIRPWGPNDRVSKSHAEFFDEVIAPNTRIEVELVFRKNAVDQQAAEKSLKDYITKIGGTVLDRSLRAEFSYHALLVEVPSTELKNIAKRKQNSLAGLAAVYSIVPQSVSQAIEFSDAINALASSSVLPNDRKPIVGVFDAVPIQAHPDLSNHLIIDDPNNLDALAVGNRVHGTAMASLVIHGDLNLPPNTIDRKIYLRPVMYADGGPSGGAEIFKEDRLVVDVMFEAVVRMRREDLGREVFAVNLSLGDPNKMFGGIPSSWARALDYLAQHYGVLFVVSAGNCAESINLKDCGDYNTFKALGTEDIAKQVLDGLNDVKADRRIIAPADSLNALTVGAWHNDSPGTPPTLGHLNPFSTQHHFPIVSSRLGTGIKRSVKPEILMSGGRQRIVQDHGGATAVHVKPHNQAHKSFGMQVAAPPTASGTTRHFTIGTSAAAALATNTLHKAFELLEKTYPDLVASLDQHHRAVLMKALLVHAASWGQSGTLFRQIVDPTNTMNHVHWKREISRFLGYGVVKQDDAIACAVDRATLWYSGSLANEQSIAFDVPIPSSFTGNTDLREVRATLAWFSPVRPGQLVYRSTKLLIASLQKDSLTAAGVATDVPQPDASQAQSGTVIHRRWAAETAATSSGSFQIQIQREDDQGPKIAGSVCYGLLVSLVMPSKTTIYDEVKSKILVTPKPKVTV